MNEFISKIYEDTKLNQRIRIVVDKLLEEKKFGKTYSLEELKGQFNKRGLTDKFELFLEMLGDYFE